LDVLQLTWSVSALQATKILDIFSESNLFARVSQSRAPGVRVHDLVVDYAIHLVREENEDGRWEECLLQACEGRMTRIRGSKDDLVYVWPWWTIKGLSGKYLAENLTRCMVRCSRDNEAIALLCDYRWIEFVNDDEERLPFQKQVDDLKLLHAHLSGENYSIPADSADSLEALHTGVELMMEGMQMCMTHCAHNREECSFQLFGRLRELRQRNAVVDRCLWSIEAYARRPWVRPGRGLLVSAGKNLKRKWATKIDVTYMVIFLPEGLRRSLGMAISFLPDRYCPVRPLDFLIFAGVPSAITSPPFTPASGPISTT